MRSASWERHACFLKAIYEGMDVFTDDQMVKPMMASHTLWVCPVHPRVCGG